MSEQEIWNKFDVAAMTALRDHLRRARPLEIEVWRQDPGRAAPTAGQPPIAHPLPRLPGFPFHLLVILRTTYITYITYTCYVRHCYFIRIP